MQTLHPFAGNAAQHGSRLINDLPGGYWQHDVVDHVLLVNNYFPPADFLDQLRQALPRLIGSYPSPQRQIADCIGRFIGHEPGHIIACNGVAEVIPALLIGGGLSVAIATPTFNPYEYSALPGKLFRFPLQAPLFDLPVEEFITFVMRSNADAAIVVSPNNPTSRAVSRDDLRYLAGRLLKDGKMLILDESFIEFSNPADSLEPDVMRYPNLIILKSLGKAYGVCGLRVGYLLTSNVELREKIEAQLPIWNINALAEFFLLRMNELRPAAALTWANIRSDRDNLARLLSSIPDMFVIPPHANFVFCRLPQHWPDGPSLAQDLLRKYRILIRHNAGKTMIDGTRYLRIAARQPAENERLIACMTDSAASLINAKVR